MANGEATLLLKIKEVGQEILDRFVITLGDVIGVAKNVASAIWSTVEAFKEEEAAINELTNAMIQSGTFTGELRQKYVEMATSLQNLTTYADEQIISAQALLQAHIGNREVTEDLVKATLDLAAGMKTDLASAANLMGKAIGSNSDVLSRHNIHVEEATDKNQKMANVIDAVTQRFGGRAQAMAQDLGRVDQLKNSWSDFLERIGSLAAPTVSHLTNLTNSVLKFVTSLMPEQFNASKSSISGITAEIQRLRIEIVKVNENPLLPQIDKERMVAQLEEQIAAHKAARDKIKEDEQKALDEGYANREADYLRTQDQRIADIMRKQEADVLAAEMQFMTDEQKIAAKIATLDKEIAAEENAKAKMQLVKDRAALVEDQKEAIRKKNQLKLETMFQQQRSDIIGAAADLITAIGDSESKAVFLIQKAAAVAQTIISTQVAAMNAAASLPYPASLAAVAQIELLGKIKLATIAATTVKGLAEGGVVKAQPGGSPFIIGEGGKDEAVIPLEDGKVPGMGGVNITINGNMIGDEQSLYALAKMLDPAFLKLRQNNESLAFDTGVF